MLVAGAAVVAAEADDVLLSVAGLAVPALVVVAVVLAELSVEGAPEVASARGAVEVVPQCSEIMRTSLTLNELPVAAPVAAVGL